MLNRYYEQELANLRQLAVEFSRANPALAPLLSGAAADPDVERLLEGVAFLTGMVRQKIDDEFPEFIQELAQLLFPHYLRPVPCATLLSFAPKTKLSETAQVPAGTAVASVPIEGTSCVFHTCFDVAVHPLRLTGVQLREVPGMSPRLVLGFELSGVELGRFGEDSLRLLLGGSFSEASRLFLLLQRYVEEISVSAPGGSALLLGPQALAPSGIDAALIPYPPQAYPGYRILQEYFILPEKFLYLDLSGLSAWTNRGSGNRFDVEIRLREFPEWAPEPGLQHFLLNTTPAVNVFPFEADPISLDHQRSDYRVAPSAGNRAHFEVYSIDEVTGFQQGSSRQVRYSPFGLFRLDSEKAAYRATLKPSALSLGSDVHLSVIYPPGEVPQAQTLSIRVTCTNGALPEGLRLGDISRATDTSPERLEFRNIRACTPHLQPPAGEALLWRLLSHLSLNYLSLAELGNLKALLGLYIFSERQDRGADLANRKRIEGLQAIEVAPESRLVGGIMMRGRHIRIRCDARNFAGQGDLFVFGCVLDRFLGCYTGINSYTRFELEDASSGERYQWPARLGQQPLI